MSNFVRATFVREERGSRSFEKNLFKRTFGPCAAALLFVAIAV